MSPSADAFSSVPLAPEDAIFALTNGYKADSSPDKINLGASPLPWAPSFLPLELARCSWLGCLNKD